MSPLVPWKPTYCDRRLRLKYIEKNSSKNIENFNKQILKNTLYYQPKKIKYDTVSDQNHNGLSVKKVENLLYIIGAFWAKKQLYQMWRLLGSKPHLIFGKQSRNIPRYYRRVLSKKATSSGSICGTGTFWH